MHQMLIKQRGSIPSSNVNIGPPMLHGNQSCLICAGASMLGRGGACGQALQVVVCPGSAGSVPATHSDQVVDLTIARPFSAPPHLESSSQVLPLQRSP